MSKLSDFVLTKNLLSEQSSYGRQYSKRSLCQSTGLCHPKRAAQTGKSSLVTGSEIIRPIDTETSLSDELTEKQRELIDSKASLIMEILNDFIDYLRDSGEKENGKYILMLPRQYTNENIDMLANVNSLEKKSQHSYDYKY